MIMICCILFYVFILITSVENISNFICGFLFQGVFPKEICRSSVRHYSCVGVSSDSCIQHGKQMMQNTSTPSPEVNTSLPVLMGAKAVLCCPARPLTNVLVITWKITLRHRPTCTMAYKKETNETTTTNCADERITWTSRPDQDPTLQIDPVALSHDGNYSCQMATVVGYFEHRYHLQVLVPPKVILYVHKNRTAECKAVAGKPAAKVFWFPPGDCLTGQDSWANGTVTVWSTCSWPDGNVTIVKCSVSYLSSEKSLSKKLLPAAEGTSRDYFLPVICPIVSLITVGFIWFLIYIFRKCKSKNLEAIPDDENELQPYASYTEKNNPLYDTVKTKMP
ncbi:cell surface glycoprotein CD200 receptor 1 [Ochotona curzoniae]|uniref:cell surface glycoprotein CD200 receptor 1 n=1 Tax=Ochotona curzoniae TaxID=130825 RepID=UPI001B34E0B2|nr:cell surface glycoprotein CD200 receptor 1 [Ochotona curzoniae]